MAVDGPAADPMAVDDQPSAAGSAGGESVRNQELLAKIAALEEKAADDAKTIADLTAEKEAAAETIVERDETTPPSQRPTYALFFWRSIFKRRSSTNNICGINPTVATAQLAASE